MYHVIDGERLIVVGVVGFRWRNLQISMIQLLQYCVVFLKYNKAIEVLSKVVRHH